MKAGCKLPFTGRCLFLLHIMKIIKMQRAVSAYLSIIISLKSVWKHYNLCISLSFSLPAWELLTVSVHTTELLWRDVQFQEESSYGFLTFRNKTHFVAVQKSRKWRWSLVSPPLSSHHKQHKQSNIQSSPFHVFTIAQHDESKMRLQNLQFYP